VAESRRSPKQTAFGEPMDGDVGDAEKIGGFAHRVRESRECCVTDVSLLTGSCMFHTASQLFPNAPKLNEWGVSQMEAGI